MKQENKPTQTEPTESVRRGQELIAKKSGFIESIHEFEALMSSIRIPVGPRAQGKRVRITVEVLSE